MTDITPLIPEGRKLIKSYGGGRFNISGQEHEGSIIILPEQVLAWPVTTIQQIDVAAIEPLIRFKDQIEVLLIGSGATFAFPAPDVLRTLKSHGMIIEVMDSGAACRTYNVLLAEERQVAAAILAV